MVCVIVGILFRYYMDKYSYGLKKNERTDNTTNLDPHMDCMHYPHSYFLFYLNSNNCVVVEGIKTQHV